MELPLFEVDPRPEQVPPALLALEPDTRIIARPNWFDNAECFTTAGELTADIEQRIKDQAAGLFTINEAARIVAESCGQWPKKVRLQVWKAIDEGELKPLDDKTRFALPLPLTGGDNKLALLHENELAAVFPTWPTTTKPLTAPATTAGQVVPKPRQLAQQEIILNCLKSMEIDPLNFPKNQAGKKGFKADVRTKLKGNSLFVGTTIFNKAWERLQKSGDIVTKQVPP